MNKIKIYSNHKQYLALPIKGRVKEIFLDELEKQIKSRYPEKSIDDFVEAVMFYDHRLGLHRLFKPGVTPIDNPANFELVYEEDGFYEINCFQVVTKEFDEEVVFE